MMSKASFLKPYFTLFGMAATALLVHLIVLAQMDKPIWANHILAAYLANVLVAGLIVWYVLKSMKKNEPHLGYLFLVGSMIKFAVFFIGFLPSYKQDGHLQHIEFFSFFIPYAICLIAETMVLVRQLNRLG